MLALPKFAAAPPHATSRRTVQQLLTRATLVGGGEVIMRCASASLSVQPAFSAFALNVPHLTLLVSELAPDTGVLCWIAFVLTERWADHCQRSTPCTAAVAAALDPSHPSLSA